MALFLYKDSLNELASKLNQNFTPAELKEALKKYYVGDDLDSIKFPPFPEKSEETSAKKKGLLVNTVGKVFGGIKNVTNKLIGESNKESDVELNLEKQPENVELNLEKKLQILTYLNTLTSLKIHVEDNTGFDLRSLNNLRVSALNVMDYAKKQETEMFEKAHKSNLSEELSENHSHAAEEDIEVPLEKQLRAEKEAQNALQKELSTAREQLDLVKQELSTAKEAQIALQEELRVAKEAQITLQEELRVAKEAQIALQKEFSTAKEAQIALQKEFSTAKEAEKNLTEQVRSLKNENERLRKEREAERKQQQAQRMRAKAVEDVAINSAKAYNECMKIKDFSTFTEEVQLKEFTKQMNTMHSMTDSKYQFKFDDKNVINLFKSYKVIYGYASISDNGLKAQKDASYGEIFMSALTYIFRKIGLMNEMSTKDAKACHKDFIEAQKAKTQELPDSLFIRG